MALVILVIVAVASILVRLVINTNMPTSMLQPTELDRNSSLSELSTLELAQVLLERLSISPEDWHKLKSNRKARASEQAAAAILFLLKDQSEEALPRFQQAVGWLDRSISAPPCPTHGHNAVISDQ
jgi:hypothetical protein